MRLLAPALALLATCSIAAAAVDYDGNLALVPAADPRVENAPGLAPALRDVHPRLLLTPAGIEALKSRVAASPLLKQVADRVVADARRLRLPAQNPLAVVTNDTPALAQAGGQWPALAYAYALDPDSKILETISHVLRRMLEQPWWADAPELDSNMGAACNLFAVAVLYDATAPALEPALRRQVAERLLVQARRLFYLGHKRLALGTVKYWQNDPANNHRWYRLRGLAAAVLAIADDPRLDTAYLRQELKKEADFIMTWFPDEGDVHEGSGYQRFGMRALFDALTMLDNALGSAHRARPGVARAWRQQLYYWVPATNASVSFGDDQNTPGRFQYDDAVFFAGPALSRDADAQAALLRRFERMSLPAAGRPAVAPTWALLAYLDPSLSGGDYRAIPANHLFADLGAASFRDSWEDDAVVLAFKCGPYGGYSLNEYRHAVPDEKGRPGYANVAHDDPDANGFSLNVAGETVFHPGVYSTRKVTRDQNTLTVGEQGQIQEGAEWIQPVPGRDMRELSYLTAWKSGASGPALVEGETGPAYQGRLERFRRTALWLPGDYVLILDDVRPGPAATDPLVWRGTVPDGRFVRPDQGLAKVVAPSGRETPIQFLADQPVSASLDDWFLAGRWGNELVRQFQFSTPPRAARLATLIDPWKRGAAMTHAKTGDTVVLVVKTPAGADTWTWRPAPDARAPSSVVGTREGRPLLALTPADLPPAPRHPSAP